MSRVIKYRVWDTKESCYITAATESNDGHGLTLDGTFSYCSQSQFGYCPDPARYIIEQFTGLLDRDGKEIYEGDIIEYFDWCYASASRPNGREPINWWFETWDKEYSHTDTYYPEVGVVAWDQVACTWGPTISSQDDFNASSFAYVCRSSSDGVPMLNSRGLPNYPDPYYRVIGNIHENRDLIPKT